MSKKGKRKKKGAKLGQAGEVPETQAVETAQESAAAAAGAESNVIQFPKAARAVGQVAMGGAAHDLGSQGEEERPREETAKQAAAPAVPPPVPEAAKSPEKKDLGKTLLLGEMQGSAAAAIAATKAAEAAAAAAAPTAPAKPAAVEPTPPKVDARLDLPFGPEAALAIGAAKAKEKEAAKSVPPKSEPVKAEPPKAEAPAKTEAGAKEADDGKKKKSRTTSSGMIRAITGTSTGEHPAVAEEFFRAENYEAAQHHDTFDDLKQPEPIPPGTKRAMMATLAIGGVAILAIGLFLYVNKVLLPQPEELGGASLPTELPQPVALPTEPTPPEPTPPVVAEGEQPPVVAEGEQPPAQVEPTPPTPPAPAAGDYATLLEQAKRARGRRAEEAWRAAIAANPNGSEALSALSFALLNRSQFTEAVELARRATAIDPTDSRAWITLGAGLDSMTPRDRAGAREAYRNCVERGQGSFVAECRRMNR